MMQGFVLYATSYKTGCIISGSPGATLFITVLVLRLLAGTIQYHWVIKDQAALYGVEEALNHISHPYRHIFLKTPVAVEKPYATF